MKQLVALVPNLPGVAPGQRFRIEAWSDHLRRNGWDVALFAFEDERLHEVIYRQGSHMQKAVRLVSCYGRQLRRTLRLPRCDAVLVYREAAMIGPAVIERLVARNDAPLVFDLDDPTFVAYRSPTSGWWSVLKFHGKTNSIFRLADRVTAVNRRIADYAAAYNPSVTVIENFVDTNFYRPTESPQAAASGPPVLVWTGSHTTAANVETIAPALRTLQEQRPARVRVVCDGPVELAGVDVDRRPFSAERQVADLQDCHIGLVPVTGLPWNHWKTFFKAIQYMAVGMPVVARRIGSNDEVVEDGVNGFLVETQQEWVDRLTLLIDDPDLRARMGAAARQTAVTRYSAPVQLEKVSAVFDEVIGSAVTE